MLWLRLAWRQGKSLQECQRSVTSSEFEEWKVALRWIEDNEFSRLEYYLASVIREIRSFKEGLRETPREVKLEDCLLPFEREVQQISPTKKNQVPISSDEEEVPLTPTTKPITAETKPPIDMDRDVPEPLSEEWQKVNDKAKLGWFQAVGMKQDGNTLTS